MSPLINVGSQPAGSVFLVVGRSVGWSFGGRSVSFVRFGIGRSRDLGQICGEILRSKLLSSVEYS